MCRQQWKLDPESTYRHSRHTFLAQKILFLFCFVLLFSLLWSSFTTWDKLVWRSQQSSCLRFPESWKLTDMNHSVQLKKSLKIDNSLDNAKSCFFKVGLIIMINKQAIINNTNYYYQRESNKRGDRVLITRITSESVILFVHFAILISTQCNNSKSQSGVYVLDIVIYSVYHKFYADS